MFLFAGALPLAPAHFQQTRAESALMAGLLVAMQGIGALLTMPIAGTRLVTMRSGEQRRNPVPSVRKVTERVTLR